MEDQEIIFKGEWFLPNKIDNKVKGTLTYNSSKQYSLLELFGSLYDYKDFNKIDFILGNTFDGYEITLHKCYIRNLRGVPKNPEQKLKMINLSRQESSSYEVEYILEGAHIKKYDELSFNEIISEIFNLDEWLGVHGFSNIRPTFRQDDGFNISLNYNEPNPIEFKINEDLDGAFRFHTTTSTTSHFQKEYFIKQTTYLTLFSKASLSLLDCIQYLFKFQNFLITSIYKPINSSNLELMCDKVYNDIRVSETEYIKAPKRVKLYYHQRNNNIKEIPRTHFQMLFTYDDIKDKFPEIISNWFEKYKILNPTFNLIFYHFYRSEKIIDVFFLNLAQAAESFHYLLNIKNKQSKILPKAEFERRRNKIKDSLNDDVLYDWVNLQLKNDLILEMRLRELVGKYSLPSISQFIGDAEIFIKQVKHSRNYYTHFDPKGEKNALTGSDLVDLYLKLQRVLIASILIEIGFDKQLLDQLFINKSSRVFN
ncbi:ApeA N-terminal domain 1-containing protein [Flavobacterium chungangense]|uniref:Uncharacterized protein n=1 Tax=Flavobacterium chungangense TaxID=554283 RepID=A0A6V6Z7K4_9FLAO|nr:HEPN domain-containing protein [Flavobacterium chungangense]CAD0007768.1 hypothetical protein FLACHUCJ7_03471 [Flavobacterium chungangense]